MITTDGKWFKDEHRRTLLLRGVNLDGKVPFTPDGSTHLRDGFFDHQNVSFIGRPFPLEQADEHFQRLKSWGLTFHRLLVPWEAVEHAGPGVYDEEYLAYLCALVEKAARYGHHILVDARQDMFSRFSGGDGAPGWTFDLLGMDITKFDVTGAAICQQTHTGPFPRQVWGTNRLKYAAATMYTLFFGSNDFAPMIRIGGETIQDLLQRHWIETYRKVAQVLAGFSNVVAFNHMNEPQLGYIGCRDLTDTSWSFYKNIYITDAMPSPLQGMALASGIPQDVEVWQPFPARRQSTRLVNPQGISLFKDGFHCPWREHGVWEIDGAGQAVPRDACYFSRVNGRTINFLQDYLRPFGIRFIETIRQVQPRAIYFFNTAALQGHPDLKQDQVKDIVFSDSWFDGVNWALKRYIPILFKFVAYDLVHQKIVITSPRGVRKTIAGQLIHLQRETLEHFGKVPTFFVETGICYDINGKRSYTKNDFTYQIMIMDNILSGHDAALSHYCLWTYNAWNTNEHGDHWNDEDFSIFSLSQRTDLQDINSGGRALEAVVRPYPKAVAGEPLLVQFSCRSGKCIVRFRHDPAVKEPTLIFLPEYQYPRGFQVRVSDGEFTLDEAERTLSYRHGMDQEIHTIEITRN